MIYYYILCGGTSRLLHTMNTTSQRSKSRLNNTLPADSLHPVKTKIVSSLGKFVATVFWDYQGMIIKNYLEKGKVNNDAHHASLFHT